MDRIEAAMDGVVVILEKLKYKKDAHRHTVYQAQMSEQLADKEDWRGNFEAVFAPTVEKAVEILRQDIEKFLTTPGVWYDAVKPDTFTFEVLYSDVKGGRFWIQPHTMPCRKYPVVLKQ